ncbi:unnamed protein product [Caenorhabditis angaria]|uniref:Uncharacterized protein n=1 Tax=Caenorhabditis angaria TaxID=860376 RepID=A0A9P1INQ4_9PELO|nr:unnamed protein product [Caenorhabditis angaria]
MLHFDDRRFQNYSKRCVEEDSRWGKMVISSQAAFPTSRRISANSSSGRRLGGSSYRHHSYHNHHHHSHSHELSQSSQISSVVATSHRIDVQLQQNQKMLNDKSHLYKTIYWRHPNLAITRECNNQEEFIGEFVFYPATNSNVIVNFFTALDTPPPQQQKLRFAHTAHTPPESSRLFLTPSDYLRKNMEILIKKIEDLQVEPRLQDEEDEKL